MDETEISRDWAKDVDTETPSRLSLISGLYEVNFPFMDSLYGIQFKGRDSLHELYM